jgi:hypothetical protein
MRSAPRVDPAGGVVYFSETRPERLDVLLDMLDIHRFERGYAVFWSDSEDVARDGYLTCLRVMGRRALAEIDHEAAAGVRTQRLYAGELLQRFVDDEARHYSVDGNGFLDGTLGSDGDRAYEGMAFGILVENAYYQAYRIWSRPWRRQIATGRVT